MNDQTPVTGLFGIPWLSLASVFGGVTSGGVVAMLIKVWPTLNQQGIDARALRRKEDRDDLHDCHDRLDKMEARLTASELRAREGDGRLVYALNALVILSAEVQKISPRSLALHQAHKLLAMAYPLEGEMPPTIADLLKPLEIVE